ncbi:UNVERIFIED_CONTAM: hypothetical protein FKN15_076262 [Acipenser sinensis]
MKTCTLVAVLLLNFGWLGSGQASRLKSAALPIQPEMEPRPSKGMSAHSHAPDKKMDHIFDGFEYFQEKDDELHKTYNDRSYLSSEDISQDDSRTDFVALLTAAADSRTTTSSGVACARFTLSRSSLVFSITIKKIGCPSRVKFIDRDGNIVFEYFVPRTASPESNMICGIWSNLQKSHIRLLKSEQLHVTMLTTPNQGEEIHGKLIKHRALFAETFSSIITSDAEHAGMGGIAMLTLSDVENNLHFILMFEGLLERREKERSIVPIRVELLYHRHVLREIRANVTSHDPDFAEVLTDLSNREMFWLSRGQLEIAVATEGKNPRRISGYITGKKSCDTIQSVLSSGDALTPTKTGAVGSATLTLHDNGTLEYQIQVAGVASKVTGVTIETKPRRRSRRNVLFDMTADYSEGRVVGTWERLNARDIHMLLQNELFLNVATSEYEEGELRGQISSLLYSGLQARLQELPVPLAGQFVSPPVYTSAAGHVWVSVDENCHLHYEIVVSGLRKSDDVTLNAHLHGFAEIGELDDSSREHKRLLKGFYGSQAEGVLKDLSMELLRHLDKGTAFIQVSTKVNPRGEIRGRKRTVICDPIICPVLDCANVIHLEDRCCPVCEEKKQEKGIKQTEKAGCYFEGDRKIHPPGTTWHPFVPPFGYIKCAVCTCRGATGEVHCEKVNCPRLTCSNPVRRSPSDCCKECPAEEKVPIDLMEMMQADGPRACKFGKNWYLNNDSWHPEVPPFGEMKCITCWCDDGVTKCQREQCPLLTCSKIARRENKCCPECKGQVTLEPTIAGANPSAWLLGFVGGPLKARTTAM